MKYLTKMQKMSFISFLLVSAVFLVYSMGYFTAFQFVENDSQTFYDEAQAFNKLLFSLSFLEIIIAALNLLFDNHKRRRFYLSNIILGFSGAISAFGMGIFLLINSFTFKNKYMALPTTNRKIILAMQGDFEPTATTFYIGMIVAVLLVVQALAIGYVTYQKMQGGRKK